MGCTTSKEAKPASRTINKLPKVKDQPAEVATRMPEFEKLVLNGHPVSQPARAVQWYVDYASKDVEVKTIDLFAGEHKTPEYLAKHPRGQVPTLEIGDDFNLSESIAILQYLADGDASLMPKTEKETIRLNEYMARHLAAVRKLSTEVVLHVFFTKENKEEKIMSGFETVKPQLERFNTILGEHDYLLGDRLTLADFLFAPEVDQLQVLNLLDTFPNIVKYLERLAKNVKGYDKCWGTAEAAIKSFMASQ